MAFTLSSPVFSNNQPIPPKYSRLGGNVSPPLEWHGAPPDVKSYALIVEDPDAPRGTFRHWAIYDFPANHTRLNENAGSAASALKQGINDFGDRRYDGPQPPEGHGLHHYHFRLAALNVDHLDVPAGPKVLEIWEAARPYVIAEAETVGTFER
jgi:hypothetical protein